MEMRPWSITKLLDYKACPYRAKLLYLDCVPTSPGRAISKGTEVHRLLEVYLSTPGLQFPDCALLQPFKTQLEALKAQNPKVEVPIALDSEWQPCGWDSHTAWLRAKLDCLVLVNPHLALLIDFKTGERYAIKHTEQERLYVLVTFLKYPSVQEVMTEFWYFKNPSPYVHKRVYTRDQGLALIAHFEPLAKEYSQAENFPPRPSRFTCSQCPVRRECNAAIQPSSKVISLLPSALQSL